MNKHVLHIALLLVCIVSWSQDEGNELYDHRLNENKWNDLRDGIRYEDQPEGPGRQWTYESDKEYREAQREFGQGGGGSGNGSGGSGSGASSPPREQEYSSPPPQMNASPSFLGGLGVLGWILMGAFVILLAFLIYYLFVNQQRDGKKITKDAIDLEEMHPSEIPLTELQRLLQEALSKGDYRGAIRIYFIFIIRDLAVKRWINWEKEKTNLHYLREMSGKSEFDDFNRSVSYFEIIWYGKREIDAQKFEQIRPNFTRFLDKLGVK